MFSNTFNTSAELFAWLRSDAGGRLLVRDDEESNYAIIYYNKTTSNMSLPLVPLCRSVIWNKVTNQPAMIAPAYGRKFLQAVDDGVTDFVVEEFASSEGGGLPKHRQAWRCEEFVDGVMINMFYDPIGLEWRLATRTQLDATGNFFGKRSFAELFWETFFAKGLTKDDLDVASTYSWVLQHPEERIVVAPVYGIPKLVLVQGPATDRLQFFAPKTYDLKTLEDVKEFVTAEGRRLGSQWQGVCLWTNGGVGYSQEASASQAIPSATYGGVRYKLRTNQYDEIRHLRGNQAKLPYTWLERWSQGKLGAYLRMYPEEQCDADAVIANFKTCTQELHDLYMQVYRKKEMPLGQAPQKYRKLLWDAHQAGKGAYFPQLRQFMNEQDTARKLWLVNYSQRYGSTTDQVPQPAPPVV